jgi:tetratricopeptide (TPR) repeat protein
MKLLHFAVAVLSAAPALAVQRSARELYNDGVGKLGKGELREAETVLREAAAANVDSVQPLALYNLGHVRFQQGVETLKGEGNRQQLLDSSDAACAVAEEAIRRGERVLESEDLQQIIAAYMEARAARKDLRIARDETRRMLDLLGSALARWRRSVGDFHSAAELDSSNRDATFNADVVERKIAELLKFKKKAEEQSEAVADEREKIKETMKKMRGKIPKDMQRESDDEEDDEEDEEKEKGEPKIGEKQQQRIGGEREVSPEMARWLKETMKRRTMSLGTKEEGEGFRPADEQRKPAQRKGRDW